MTDDLFVIAKSEHCFQEKSKGTLLYMVISEQWNYVLKF